MNIYITGFYGAGKSTVGRHLAQSLGWEFVEVDAEIVREVRTPLSVFIKQEGMRAYKDKETDILHRLSEAKGAVIATNAGSLTTREAVARARNSGKIVFINTPFHQCHRRIDGDVARPFTYGKTKLELHEVFNNKFKVFSSTADFAVNGLYTPAQIAAEIKTWLKAMKLV